MAKKRSASRPSSSSGGKKAKTSKSPRKSAAKPAPKKTPKKSYPKKTLTGLEDPKVVDFNPLKTQIRAHIDRLSKVKNPSDAVTGALRSLRQVADDLTGQCQPTMSIPTP